MPARILQYGARAMRSLSAPSRSRRASAVVLVLALSVAGSSVPVALAAPDTAAPTVKVDAASHDRAQKAYQEALKLYKNGQYRAAVDRLVEARKLDPTAKELPYNLGLVYEKLNNLDESIRSFELYLNLETDADEKERVRGIIQRLQGARAEQLRAQPSATAPASTSARPPPPPPPPPTVTSEPPPPERHRGRLDGWVYGTGTLAVAAGGAGVVLGVLALGKRPADDVKTTRSGRDAQRKAHNFAVGADIAFGVEPAESCVEQRAHSAHADGGGNYRARRH